MTTRTPHKDIHGKVTTPAHQQWRQAVTNHGISITGLWEALAPDLDSILNKYPGIVDRARAVDAARRLRPNSGQNQNTTPQQVTWEQTQGHQ